MAPEIGYFALLLAFLVSITQSAMPFVAARRRDLAVVAFVDQAALAQLRFIVVAFGCLTCAFVTSDFPLEVVTANAHSAKPLLYKVSGAIPTGRRSISSSGVSVFVLLNPPMKPDTLALWFGPLLFLLMATLGFGRYLRRRSNEQGVETPIALTTIEQQWMAELLSRRD